MALYFDKEISKFDQELCSFFVGLSYLKRKEV